jgi:hypothetical protein
MIDSILGLLKAGPVPTRKLLRNRKGAFRLAYAKLLQDGAIVEHGTGRKLDPKYTGLPGSTFPDRRLTINPADVVLLMLAGASEEEAKAALATAIATGGINAVIRVCGMAEQKILDRGLNPYRELPRAVNRRRKGKTIVSKDRLDRFPEGEWQIVSSATD